VAPKVAGTFTPIEVWTLWTGINDRGSGDMNLFKMADDGGLLGVGLFTADAPQPSVGLVADETGR
jgi:hypothetical protein